MDQAGLVIAAVPAQTDTVSSNDSATADVSITKPAAIGGGGGGALGSLSLLFVGLLSFTRRRSY
ncbi:MAG: hypothetical protein ACRETO_10535 [Gammaproteobacteria bacterium]